MPPWKSHSPGEGKDTILSKITMKTNHLFLGKILWNDSLHPSTCNPHLYDEMFGSASSVIGSVWSWNPNPPPSRPNHGYAPIKTIMLVSSSLLQNDHQEKNYLCHIYVTECFPNFSDNIKMSYSSWYIMRAVSNRIVTTNLSFFLYPYSTHYLNCSIKTKAILLRMW